MSKIIEFLSGGAGKLVDSIGGIIDDLNLSKEEKEQFKLLMAQEVRKDREMTEQTIQKELDTVRSVITAELQQGDTYTKRARPTIVYAGLGFIGINYVLFPVIYWLITILGYFLAADLSGLPEAPQLDMPTEFWVMLGGVVSVWSIGRTAEKRGVSNKFTELAKVMGTGKL